MITINMLSSADMVKGQGVSSAYAEQVNLVSNGLKDTCKVLVNSNKRCNIMHFHTIDPTFYLSASVDKKKCALVGYVHFLPDTIEESLKIPRFGRNFFYKYMIEFYKSMDYLVAVNPYFIKELEKYGIDPAKITYIPNYVSNEQFYPLLPDEISEIKKNWGIPQDKFIILGVGQIQTRKGIFDFIETAKKMEDCYFIWVGGFSFGPITEGYKELKAIMNDPPPNVHFIGLVERIHMNDIYNIADVSFLPSFNELFPMTVLESMCCHKPILLRDLDIYKDILFQYYLKGNTVDEFVDILYTLRNNPNEYKKWRAQSQEGNRFYSQENILNMWEAFYKKVFEESQNKYTVKKTKLKKVKTKLKKQAKKLKLKKT